MPSAILNNGLETQEFMEQNQVQIQSWGPFAEGKNGRTDYPALADPTGVIAIPKSGHKDRMQKTS